MKRSAGRSPKRAVVLIADDHGAIRRGLRLAVEARGYTVCAQCASLASAVADAVRMRPDICLIADDMSGDSAAAVAAITAAQPQVRVVFLVERWEDANVPAMLRAGAAGCLPKNVNLERLSAVLDAVLAGEPVIPRGYMQQLVAEVRQGWSRRRVVVVGDREVVLTSREWDVLQLLARNRSTAQIAQALGTASPTIRTYVHLLRRKLGADPRSAAAGLLAVKSV